MSELDSKVTLSSSESYPSLATLNLNPVGSSGLGTLGTSPNDSYSHLHSHAQSQFRTPLPPVNVEIVSPVLSMSPALAIHEESKETVAGSNHQIPIRTIEPERKLYEFEQQDDDDEDEELGVNYIADQGLSRTREKWVIFSEWMTVYIPDCILNKDQNTRQAFREKVTLFELFLLTSAIFIFIFAFLPGMLCHETRQAYTWKAINKNKDPLMVVKGRVLDAKLYVNSHPGPIDKFREWFGRDVTHMFEFPNYGYGLPSTLQIYPQLEYLFLDFKKNDTNRYCANHFCHPFPTYLINSTVDTKNIKVLGNVTLSYPELEANPNPNWVILYNQVYNLSDYVEYGAPVYPAQFDYTTKRKELAYYLDERLNNTLMNRLGHDATYLFEQMFMPQDRDEIITYLNTLYYQGTIDTRQSNGLCALIDPFYLIVLCVISAVLLSKFFLSLCILRKQYPKCKTKHVVVFVPCYTENYEAVEKTVHSIFDSNYPDDKKLVFIIADGVVKGKGNDKSTAEIALGLFNRTLDQPDQLLDYDCDCVSDADRPKNRARVYSGWHQNGEHTLPYIVVVKTGLPEEQNDAKRGNRGKRDSQLLLFHFLRKCHYQRPLNDLETELLRCFQSTIKIPVSEYQFLLSVDADTSVDTNAIIQMMYRMKDPKINALCGETQISNKIDSWVTVIQVYEYYFNHNLNKAFESLFSSVTCLPGCFTMYRIRSECMRKKPILINEKLLEEYSDKDADTLHKKNLLLLGEDRFLTTLLTKRFRQGKLKYIVEAKCKTTVPNTWSVLLSQRRRWINSTIHNMFQLLLLDTMCGCCCVSMKFMVLVDIITTVLLPSSCLYLFYLIYTFIVGSAVVSNTFIIIMTVVLGVQVLIFVIKRDFEYIIWFALYLLASPIWMIVLPVYSFLKMDDFSWGSTRKISKTTTTDVKKYHYAPKETLPTSSSPIPLSASQPSAS